MRTPLKLLVFTLLALLATIIVPRKAAATDFKDAEFLAGMVLKDAWSPGWGDLYLSGTLEALKGSGARWVAFHHFWSYSSTSTPVIESSYQSEGFASNEARIVEFEAMVKEAKDRGYKVLIIPSLYFGNMLGSLKPEEETLLNVSLYGEHTAGWYDAWFACYQNFLDEVTAVAERQGVDMISLGFHRTYVTQDGRDGYDTTARWRELITRVRSRYSGKLLHIADSQGLESSNLREIAFWDDVDYIGVLLTGGIAQHTGVAAPTKQQVIDAFQVMYSTLNLAGYYNDLGKKTVLITSYSSSDKCWNGDWFEEFEPQPNIAEDPAAQERLYDALYTSVSTHTWIGGVFPWGYWWKGTSYNNAPGDASFEKGPSVRGKAAEATIAAYTRALRTELPVLSTAAAIVSITPETGPVNVCIPAGCFSQNVTLAVATAQVSGLAARYSGGTITAVGSGIDISASGAQQPLSPATVEISYRAADVPGSLAETSLVMARFDTASNEWVVLSSTAYPALNKVVAVTSHFSPFLLVGLTPDPVVPPVTTSTATAITELSVFPNPFKPLSAASATITPVQSGSTVNIYTIHGELVRNVEVGPSATSASWDGKNQDGTVVASGIYLVSATANDGKKYVKKLAVIK